MANPLRITMFFDDGITGWSESHYDTLSQSLTQAISFAVANLLPSRVNFLANGPWLKYVRASYDNVYRDSQVVFTPQPAIAAGTGQYQNNPQWNAYSAATEWTCVLLRGVGGDLYRSLFYISGIPFNDPTDVDTPFFDPVMVSAFKSYSTALVNNSYGFAVWIRDQVTWPLRNIVSVVPTIVPAPGWTFNIPLHGFDGKFGTRIFLYGMRFLIPGPPPPKTSNGPYPYQVIDANNIFVPNFRFPTNGIFIAGQAQENSRGVVPYQSVLMERFTRRKRGRPFDSPRGRSRRGTRTSLLVG